MIEKPYSEYPVLYCFNMLVNLVSLLVEILLQSYDIHERPFDILILDKPKYNFLAFGNLYVLHW